MSDESFQRHAKKNPEEHEIKRLANLYKVSREVILRKFYDREFISKIKYKDELEKYKQEWRASQLEKEQRESEGPSYFVKIYTYLGQKYLEIAFRQYHQKKINDRELADYLGVKTKSLEKLESYTMKGWKE